MDQSLFRYAWRHSQRAQIILLLAILASLPFYWISLEVPKLIVNNAIQGHAFEKGQATAVVFDFAVGLPDWLGGYRYQIYDGIRLERMPYLFALSGWFLVLTLINGAFKYYINVKKGILGEYMLQRMRHDLFVQLMRFRPEDVAAVKPAEVASMIKDEVDPIGGFIGDAFIQPIFLASQALTALIFIMAQSFLMGAATLVIVLSQTIIIPILRRELLRLGRRRQIESRRLAGRIGEVVESAAAIHSHGASDFVTDEIDRRLGVLYRIRSALFRRKFAVKFLNNLLAQVTPFLFYAVGGYFALKGTLNIGQLVAVISAYRDLPPPIKELIDWDQQRQDVAIKYEQVIIQFSPATLLPAPEDQAPQPFPADGGAVEFLGVGLVDPRGARLLNHLSFSFPRPSHVAVAGERASGQDLVAKLLGRQILGYQGTIRIGGVDLAAFSEREFTRHLVYVAPEPHFGASSLRQNLLIAVRRRPAGASEWLDFEAMGIERTDQVDGVLLSALAAVGAIDDVYRFGMRSRFPADVADETLEKFVRARRLLHERLAGQGMARLVEQFDAGRYAANATIGENLLFGIPAGERLSADGLARDPYTRSILEAEGLLKPLVGFGVQIAEMAVETFAGLPPEHPVFERYSFIDPARIDEFKEMVEAPAHRSTIGFPAEARTKLLELAFAYIEPRHRLSLIDDVFKERLLRARTSFRRFLPLDYRPEIDFYDRDRYIKAAPLVDNLLFGRIERGLAKSQPKIFKLIREVLHEQDLDVLVHRLGLDFDTGKAGKYLQPVQRVRFALARGLVGHPDILVVDNTLSSLDKAAADPLIGGLHEAMAGRTLVIAMEDGFDTGAFNQVLCMKNGHLAAEPEARSDQSAAE